jgi:hypothetical protein
MNLILLNRPIFRHHTEINIRAPICHTQVVQVIERGRQSVVDDVGPRCTAGRPVMSHVICSDGFMELFSIEPNCWSDLWQLCGL